MPTFVSRMWRTAGLAAAIDRAREVMEGAAHPAVHLDVALAVDAGQGANWAEAH